MLYMLDFEHPFLFGSAYCLSYPPSAAVSALAIDRGDTLDELDDKAQNLSNEFLCDDKPSAGDRLGVLEFEDKSLDLNSSSAMFHKKSVRLRRRLFVQTLLTKLCCCACLAVYFGMSALRRWHRSRKLIDGVFADLENLFYLLSSALFRLTASPQHGMCVKRAKLLLLVLLVYPLVLLLCVVTIFPSLFLLLGVRVNKIETDTKQLNVRRAVLEAESKCKRGCRLAQQFVRSSLVFAFIALYPLLITYVIIPKYKSDLVVLASIGSYLGTILALQLLGTYRGLKSYSQKLKTLKNVRERYTPQRFKWNMGSLIAVALLLYEAVQLAMFATHTISDASHASSDSPRMESGNEYLSLVLKLSYLSFDFVSAHKLQFYSLYMCLALPV